MVAAGSLTSSHADDAPMLGVGQVSTPGYGCGVVLGQQLVLACHGSVYLLPAGVSGNRHKGLAMQLL